MPLMRRTRKKRPGPKVWIAALATVIGLFVLTDDRADAERILTQLLGTLEQAPQNTLTGTASVIDGDTLDLHGTRVRLHAIDAPESRQTCGRPEWRCGQQAALALSDKIARRPITCQERDIDRYGRVVATCFAGGENLNAWMVRQGWAVAYLQYGRDYAGDEAAAKAAGRNIWAGPFTMPQDWRRKR